MAMFDMRVIPDGGEPFDISAGMRDVRLWEKTHAKRSLGMLRDEGGVSATVLYEIAFTACRRSGSIPADMTEDVFADSYEIDIETPKEREARLRAEALKARIIETPLPGEFDTTPPDMLHVEVHDPHTFNGFENGEQEEPDPLGIRSARYPEPWSPSR